MKPAIEIRNLGKQYKLSTAEPYISLRDVLAGSVRKMFKHNNSAAQKIWALNDIDLDIMPGERVGIIGRNGAGKSTLLKIISRITTPTTGHAIIRGRVGSLLEVGTGFHPELTGRENIFLNGSILGLKKSEIIKQLDAIIDFSGVEKFIDTPLKHYSSGMQLRLAFAVAAHLEPEILLIDEVLAVGDIEFQKKCIGKMEEVSKEQGRTILFVSHQLNAIMKLCTKAFFLVDGKISFIGTVNETIEKYIKSLQRQTSESSYFTEKQGDQSYFRCAELLTPVIEVGNDIVLRIGTSENYKNRAMIININIYNETGDLISHILNEDDAFSTENLRKNNLLVTLKKVNLSPGKYSLSFWAGLDMLHGLDKIENAIVFEIKDQQTFTKRVATFPRHAKAIIQSVWREE